MNPPRESTSVRKISHLIEEALQQFAEERAGAEPQRSRAAAPTEERRRDGVR